MGWTRLGANPPGRWPPDRHSAAVARHDRGPSLRPDTSSAASCPASATAALLLGELVDTHGRLHDLHLKGSGRTPFARGGDGLAALGPMLREYLISEAMHALGVPTTRSLSVVATGRTVQREELLQGAVLARVASSHLRIGSFQYAATTGDLDLLRHLADHAIARHHPTATDADNPHLALLDAVVAPKRRCWPDGCWSGSSTAS